MPAAHLLLRKIHSITAWVAKSKGRQEEPTAPTAARLIGCGGRAAAAAAAVVGTHDIGFFSRFLSGNTSSNTVPTALLLLLCARYITVHRGVGGVTVRENKR